MTRRPTLDLVRPSPHVLRQYALIADGERGALIGPRGDIAFLCAPSWHDDAVFSSLLGGHGGYGDQPGRRPVRVGRLLRARQPDLAQPLGVDQRASSSAARPSRSPATRTGSFCCDGSRPPSATPTSRWSSTVRAEFGARTMTVRPQRGRPLARPLRRPALPMDRGHPARAPRGRPTRPRPRRAGRRVPRPGPGDLHDAAYPSSYPTRTSCGTAPNEPGATACPTCPARWRPASPATPTPCCAG